MSSILTAYLDANTSKFQEGLNQAEKRLTSFGTIFKTAFKAELALKSIEMVGDALKHLTVEAYESIDATEKQANALGANIANFQAMATAGRDAGVSQDQLVAAMNKSQASIVGNSDALRALGLSQSDLLKLSPDEQFNKIATAISGVSNATERTAITMQIFGKGNANLINLFDGYADKLKEAREFNDKFNISLNAIDTSKVVEANDTWEKVKLAMTGLGNTIAVKTAPMWQWLGQLILDCGIDGENFGKAVDKGMQWASDAIDVVRASVLGLQILSAEAALSIERLALSAVNNLSTLADKAASIPKVGGAFSGIASGLNSSRQTLELTVAQQQNVLDDLKRQADDFKLTSDEIDRINTEADQRARKRAAAPKPVTEGGADAVLSKFNQQQEALKRQQKLMKDILGPTVDLQQTLSDLSVLYQSGKINADQYNEAIDKLRLKMAELDKTAGGGVKAGLLKVKEEMNDLGDIAEKTIVDGFGKAEDALVDFVTTGKLSFKDMMKSIEADLARMAVQKSITGPLSSLLDAAFDGKSGSGGGNMFSSLWNSFSGMFADGGYIPPGKWGIAGEAGAEPIFGGRTGATVIPNGGNGGGNGGINLTVINNAGVKVSAQQSRNGNGGMDMKIQLDQAVAGLLSDSGSKSSRALSNGYGLNPTLSRR